MCYTESWKQKQQSLWQKKKVLAAVRTMASDAPGRNNYQDLGKELEGETESWGVQKDCDYNKINI